MAPNAVRHTTLAAASHLCVPNRPRANALASRAFQGIIEAEVRWFARRGLGAAAGLAKFVGKQHLGVPSVPPRFARGLRDRRSNRRCVTSKLYSMLISFALRTRGYSNFFGPAKSDAYSRLVISRLAGVTLSPVMLAAPVCADGGSISLNEAYSRNATASAWLLVGAGGEPASRSPKSSDALDPDPAN